MHAFRFLYMVFAIDITYGCGLSNKVCYVLATVEEEQGNANAVFAVHFTVKAVNQLYITNKSEHFQF